MFARLHAFTLPPEEQPGAGEVVEQILPTLRGLEGYRGILVLSDLDRGRIVSVSLWESVDTMNASREVTEKIRRAETSSRDVDLQEASVFRVVGFDLTR